MGGWGFISFGDLGGFRVILFEGRGSRGIYVFILFCYGAGEFVEWGGFYFLVFLGL